MTDSTSMGLALLYSGLKLKSSDEVLTTNHDHYAVESALLVHGAHGRSGQTHRHVSRCGDRHRG